MTTTQLQALLVDEAMGELSEDASALLAAWLEHSPGDRALADEVRRSVALTGAAVASRPLDLETGAVAAISPPKVFLPRFLRAAAVIALLGLALGAGFHAGKTGGEFRSRGGAVASSRNGVAPSPWARYRVDESGRLAVTLPGVPKS